MGRTNPTYRDALRVIESNWADFRRALRGQDQPLFDQLFSYAFEHADAGGLLNHHDPLLSALFSIDLEQESRIETFGDQLEAFEHDLTAHERRFDTYEERLETHEDRLETCGDKLDRCDDQLEAYAERVADLEAALEGLAAVEATAESRAESTAGSDRDAFGN